VALSHSIEEFLLFVETVLRDAARASQIIHMNKITETKEINDPREETIFQVTNASG
jgi:hypothetical protein